MGPVLLKLLREAIIGSHEAAKHRTAPAGVGAGVALPMDVGFSPFTAILGLFAKFTEADGRASAYGVGETEEILAELGLVGEDRREAMGLFQAAAESPLGFAEMLVLCRDHTRDNAWLRAVLVSLLFRLAHAAGLPTEQTTTRLQQACARLGRDYQESLCFFNEESAQRAVEKRWVAAKMNIAYGILGCGGEEPLEAIKRRYRSLAKELHPDVVAARGLPEADIQSRLEKFHEVQEAYQFVLVQRGSR